jgi:hypothetical protein
MCDDCRDYMTALEAAAADVRYYGKFSEPGAIEGVVPRDGAYYLNEAKLQRTASYDLNKLAVMSSIFCFLLKLPLTRLRALRDFLSQYPR